MLTADVPPSRSASLPPLLPARRRAAGVVNCILAEIEAWNFHDFSRALPSALPANWVELSSETLDGAVGDALRDAVQRGEGASDSTATTTPLKNLSMHSLPLDAALPGIGKNVPLPDGLTEETLAEVRSFFPIPYYHRYCTSFVRIPHTI